MMAWPIESAFEGHLPVEDPVSRWALLQPDAPALVMHGGGMRSWRDWDAQIGGAVAALRDAGFKAGDGLAFQKVPDVGVLTLLAAALRLKLVVCPLNTRLPEGAARDWAVRIGLRWYDVPDDFPPVSSAVPTFLDLARPATLVFTSGSSGTPKAALHALGNHWFSALGSAANIPLQAGNRWWLSLPLYHVSGLGIFFRCWQAGATMVLGEWESVLVEAVAKKSGITHVSLVSTQFQRLLEAVPIDAPAPFSAILLGGSAMPDALIQDASQRNWPVFLSYGMTEMASQIATTRAGNPDPGAMQVLPHREVRVSDEGELLVRGKTRFMGYWDGKKVSRPFDASGWFATKDLGHFAANGTLAVSGRKDHLFISGGENIQPEAIEQEIRAFSGIQDVLVLPVPDAVFGFRPAAIIQGVFDPAELSDFLRNRLAGYQIPVAYWAWPSDAPQGFKPDRAWFTDWLRQQMTAIR